MRCNVTPPHVKGWDANTHFMQPTYNALGDLLCKGKGKGSKFCIVCGVKWFNELEGKSQEFTGRQYTVKERLLTCSFFTSVGYDRKLGDYEVELRPDC
jgi:hypothetical protein